MDSYMQEAESRRFILVGSLGLRNGEPIGTSQLVNDFYDVQFVSKSENPVTFKSLSPSTLKSLIEWDFLREGELYISVSKENGGETVWH